MQFTLPLELESDTHARRYRWTIHVVALITGAFLGWASLTPMRELTTGKGQIIPSGQVRSVQHLEGGIVASLQVKEGQRVKKDEPLLRLEPVQAEADFEALKARIQGLTLRKARVEALLAGRDMSADTGLAAYGTVAADQRTQFDAIVMQKLRERQTLASQADQRRSEIATAELDITKSNELLAVQRELLDMREKLAKEGFASRKMVLDAQVALLQAQAAVQGAVGRLAAGRDALAQAESRLEQADADARATWSDEQSKVASDLAEARESLQRYVDRIDRLVVKSPVDGVVLQLAVRTEHEVVKPGDVVARVVPHGEQLQAEVQIQPEDIGHIGINDYAELRFAAFDPSVYGKIRGKVVDIAPYTLENDQKHLYYRVRVGFDPMDAVGGYMPMNVQPGLVVDAQIVTGAKSLIHYMLKPIYRGLDSAFAER